MSNIPCRVVADWCLTHHREWVPGCAFEPAERPKVTRQTTGILAGHYADGRGHDTDFTCCPYPPVATGDELAEDSEASTDWRFGFPEPASDTYVELPERQSDRIYVSWADS